MSGRIYKVCMPTGRIPVLSPAAPPATPKTDPKPDTKPAPNEPQRTQPSPQHVPNPDGPDTPDRELPTVCPFN